MSDFEQKLFARQATAAMEVERERATYGARLQVDRDRAERRERLLNEAHYIGRQAVDVLKKNMACQVSRYGVMTGWMAMKCQRACV